MSRPTPADAQQNGKGRRSQSAVRRRQIIDVTVDMVGRYGIQGASLAVIAEGVGVTDAALYKYFGSKDDILIAAYDSIAHRVFAWIESFEHLPASVALRSMCESHARLFSQDISGFNAPMFQFNLWRPEDRIGEHVVKTQGEIMDAVARVVERGKADGSVRPDIDTEIIVAEIFAWIWWEDLSHLRALDPKGIARRSGEIFARVLTEIRPEGRP